MARKRGRAKKIQINLHLTNRWLYTLIALGILAIIVVGVYAVIPNPGHSVSEIDFTGKNIPLSGAYGLDWQNNPWGGSGDDAWIKYVQDGSGENAELQIGISNDGNDNIAFYQQGAERMTIQNGRVGIGTTNPGAILDIGTWTDWNTPALRFSKSGTNTRDIRIINDGAGLSIKDFTGTSGTIFNIRTSDDTQRFVVDNNGNVGIGTTNPSAKLDVAGDISAEDNTLSSCSWVSLGACPSGKIMAGYNPNYMQGSQNLGPKILCCEL